MKQRKSKFDQAAAAAREPEVLAERTYTRAAVDRGPTQFELLPEELQEVCVMGALPLGYVGPEWDLIVSTNLSRAEFGMVLGAQLHKRWEDRTLDHLGLDTILRAPGGNLPVLCPDGTHLSVKILSEEL